MERDDLPKIYFDTLLSSTKFHFKNKMKILFQENFWKLFAAGTMGPMSYNFLTFLANKVAKFLFFVWNKLITDTFIT